MNMMLLKDLSSVGFYMPAVFLAAVAKTLTPY
jgi:hypothetical protein